MRKLTTCLKREQRAYNAVKALGTIFAVNRLVRSRWLKVCTTVSRATGAEDSERRTSFRNVGTAHADAWGSCKMLRGQGLRNVEARLDDDGMLGGVKVRDGRVVEAGWWGMRLGRIDVISCMYFHPLSPSRPSNDKSSKYNISITICHHGFLSNRFSRNSHTDIILLKFG